MPRPRRAAGASQFIDDSAQRAGVGDSDRAPRNLSRKDAIAYNKNQDEYCRELNRYATSAATRVKPQYVAVPPARKTKPKPVVGVVSNPALPGNITVAKVVREGKSKAELKRISDAKKVAAFRRENPGPLTHAEQINTGRLVEGGVNKFTWCGRDQMKTPNYDSKVLPVKRWTMKNGKLSAQRYRLVSKCRICHEPKNTLVRGTDPAHVSGGRI